MSRILIAEDDTRIVAFLEKGLRAAGYTITHAATVTRRCCWPAVTRSTSSSST